jgi:hypothetical protein
MQESALVIMAQLIRTPPLLEYQTGNLLSRTTQQWVRQLFSDLTHRVKVGGTRKGETSSLRKRYPR